MIDLKDKLKFLHLGSGDGVTDDTFCDYISTYSWTGTLIEPLPDLYQKVHVKYNDNPNITTLMCGVDFHSSFHGDVFWFEYPFRNNNHCTIYNTQEQAMSDISRLIDVENLKEWSKFKLLSSLKNTSIEYVLYSKLLSENNFDLVHICEPIINSVTTSTWQHIQNMSATNNVSMISYDKPDGSSRLCENVNTNIYKITNKGIGELDVNKFSNPTDYGVSEFLSDIVYEHRIDRNLLTLK